MKVRAPSPVPCICYRKMLAANAVSSKGFPVGAQTCWFHCFFKSFARRSGEGEILRAVEGEACGIKTAKLLTVVKIRFTAAATRAPTVAFEICADCNIVGRF